MGADIWNADCNRCLVAMLSLEKKTTFWTQKNTVFIQIYCHIWKRCPCWYFQTVRRKDPTSCRRIASSSKTGGLNSFELFGIWPGDKNTQTRWTSGLFYDHNSCSRWAEQEKPATTYLLHVLIKKVLIINGDARRSWSHLVEDGSRGKALSYTSNHSTLSYTDSSEPQVPVQHH